MKVTRERLLDLVIYVEQNGGWGHVSDEDLAEHVLWEVQHGHYDKVDDSDFADLIDEIRSANKLEVGEPDQPQLGVIDTIVEVVKASDRRNPVTHESVLWELKKRFPERDPERMMNTVRKWLPSRLRAEKHLNVASNQDGYYYDSWRS